LGILSLFSFFYFTTGNFLIQFAVYSNPLFQTSTTIPGVSILYAFLQLFQGGGIDSLFYNSLNVVMGILFILAIVISFLFMPLEYGLYMLFYGVLTFSQSTIMGNMRYYLLMFPAFILLAKFQENKYIRLITKVMYPVFIILMVLFVIRHVNNAIDFSALFAFL